MIEKFNKIPSKIVALGLNYKAHAAEFNMEPPAVPLIFLKPSTSVIFHGEPIIYPAGATRVDFEAELAVVIGKKCRNIAAEESIDYILGYTCLNDVTERHIQGKDGQWTRAKGFDTFCPIGPVITDEIDPSSVGIRSFVNGELKQCSNTSDLVFSVPDIIEFVSSVMTLLPGDVIATGTPSGVGQLKIGDEVTIEIDGIGRLTNTVKKQE